MKAEPQSTSIETSWQRLDGAFRTVLTVSKEELLKKEAKLKAVKAKKKASKKPS